MFARGRRNSVRRGVTLIELLVVVGIMLMLMAIAVPALQTGLEGRRVREAARAVSAMFQVARSHAVETRRPVGVLFERFSKQPQASIVLREMQVPPPYAGDTIGAVVQVQATVIGGVAVVQAGVPVGAISDDLIQPGDQVQLNHQGPLYTLGDIPPNPDSDADGYIDFNAAQDANNDGWYDPPAVLTMTLDLSQGYAVPWGSTFASNVPVPFVIHRQPVPTSADPVQLPRGALVDLAASGPDSLLPWTFEPSGPNEDLNQNGALDAGEDLNGNSLLDIPDPVIVMFSPNGAVESVYYSRRVVDPQTGAVTVVYARTRVTEPIHFQIGEWERLPATVRDLGAATLGPMPPSQAEDKLYNWQDATNFWVALNAQTGLITLAKVYSGDDLAANYNPATNMWVPVDIAESRGYARQAQLPEGGY